MLTRDIDIAIMPVCLSVRLSVCLSVSVSHVAILYRSGLTYQHTFFGVDGRSPVIPVLNILAKFRWGPYGALNMVGYINFAIFDQCLAISGKRYKIGQYRYYGIVIGNHDISNDLE